MGTVMPGRCAPLASGVRLLCATAARFLSRCEAVRPLGRFPSVSAWPSGRAAALRPASLRSKRPRWPLLRASCHAAPVRGAVLSPPTARKLSGTLGGAFPLSLRIGLSPLLTTAVRFWISSSRRCSRSCCCSRSHSRSCYCCRCHSSSSNCYCRPSCSRRRSSSTAGGSG